MTRRETIAELLRRYREAEASGDGRSGGATGLSPLMPATWNGSYRQLERLLEQLATLRPKQHRHLMARYVDATFSRRRLIRKSGRWVGLGTHSEVRVSVQLADRRSANEWDCVVASWPDWVREHQAESAVGWLTRSFQGEPYLPLEMVKAL